MLYTLTYNYYRIILCIYSESLTYFSNTCSLHIIVNTASTSFYLGNAVMLSKEWVFESNSIYHNLTICTENKIVLLVNGFVGFPLRNKSQ